VYLRLGGVAIDVGIFDNAIGLSATLAGHIGVPFSRDKLGRLYE
jgi:hypothetical protein